MLSGLAVATAVAAPAEAATSVAAPGFNGVVLSVVYAGDTIYVGGNFTAALVKGKSIARGRLAAIDAATGALLPWNPGADGRVKALVVDGASVYAAGDFSAIGGKPRDSLARLDAATGEISDTFQQHDITGRPYALVAGNGRLYLGGAFTAVDGQPRAGLAAFNLGTGVLDATWKPTVDDQVETLATGPSRIYVGGKFHKVNALSGHPRLVALNPKTGATVSGFKARPNVIAYAVAVTADGVYSAHGGQGGKINAYTLTGTLRWTATFDGDGQAIAVRGDTVYAGGHFDNACRTPRTGDHGVCLEGSDPRVKLAALNAADGVLLDWTADANGVEGVLAMAASADLGLVAVGGAFTTIGGVSQKRFAQFD